MITNYFALSTLHYAFVSYMYSQIISKFVKRNPLKLWVFFSFKEKMRIELYTVNLFLAHLDKRLKRALSVVVVNFSRFL